MSADPASSIPPKEDHFLDLDSLPHLPFKNRVSVWAMLFVQALNAFTDNFVKILLIALAGVVSAGTDLGDSMQLYLGAIFSLPYILFAPVAGWISDRYAKHTVIAWSQFAQLAIFVIFYGALQLKDSGLSLQLGLFCFFLIATQSAIFSPAKMGIGKELVGSSRIGNLTGKLQLTNFMGILGGMGIAGWWFGSLIQNWSRVQQSADDIKTLGAVLGFAPPLVASLEETARALLEVGKAGLFEASWEAATYLLGIAILMAGVQVLGSFFIQRTPSHQELKFKSSLWWEHLDHLKLLFADRPIRLAAIGITFFWFMSNSVGSILVTLSHEMHPIDKSAAAKELSMMPAMLGIGVMLGSFVAGWVCRKRLEMGLVPISGFLLAGSLFWTGVVPVSPGVYAALIAVGVAGGAFMTPLYAFVQDRSRPEERARILSAINLLDCVGAVVANMVMIKLFLYLELSSATQILLLVPLALASAFYVTRLLPQGVLRMIALSFVKMGYNLKVLHEDRLPKEEGVLLLPNHVSYVDTLLLGASSRRDLRFVMLDSLYQQPKLKWAFDAFGTVPISATKAREAIKTVAQALENQQAVVLFPEGQLSRTGFTNPLRKGYELMARLGHSKIQVVWVDGVWHSMFAYKDGYAIKKTPQRVRLPVQVVFGPILTAEEATPRRVRLEWMKLSAEAFEHRKEVSKALVSASPVERLNALRIDDTHLFNAGDQLFVDSLENRVLYDTFTRELASLQGMKLTQENSIKSSTSIKEVSMKKLSDGTYVLHAIDALDEVNPEETHVWLYDAESGALLTASGHQAITVVGEKLPQVSSKAGTFGRILPGFEVSLEEHGTCIKGLMGKSVKEVFLAGLTMDEDGFLVKQ